MTSLARERPETRLVVPFSTLRRLVLALVSVTMAVSAVVFSEPAPVDLLMIALIVLLPMVGLFRATPSLLALLTAWLACGAAGLFAAPLAGDVAKATIYNLISIYLYVSAFSVAAFVADAPARHARLILGGMTAAGLVAAAAALAGALDLVPGAAELFTKFGRAAGTFKDPNVLGSFLVAPALFALHLLVERPLRRTLPPVLGLLVLAGAVLLSFSRGAWICLALAVLVYGYLAFVTAPEGMVRARIAITATLGAAAVAAVVAVALQHDGMASLMAERASFSQGYDLGPDGRFGGQQKALSLILENPFGIGAQEFAVRHHHEEAHNVYLSMFLNAGWAGGLVYAGLVLATLVLGLRHALAAAAPQPLFLVVYAAFLGNAVEGFVIDSDHWRHFFVLMGLVWGLMAAPARPAPVEQGAGGRRHARS
jgi:O-antigen ligase